MTHRRRQKRKRRVLEHEYTEDEVAAYYRVLAKAWKSRMERAKRLGDEAEVKRCAEAADRYRVRVREAWDLSEVEA